MAVGKVYLVGAGPGDPGLMTVRGRACLALADVVVADHLVNPLILADAPGTAEVIVRPARRSGAFGSQDEINRLLVARAGEGRVVVRLKGGDPFVFGRGGEEAEALVAAGIPFEVVPGVTAAIAAPAYAGIPLTHRGLSGVVAFATGHETDDKEGGAIDWEAVARGAGTLVLYMSVSRLGDVVRRLLAAGRKPDEPVAVIESGTLPGQRTLTGTLGDIVDKSAAAGIRPPALTVVGEVVRLRERIAWFESAPLRGRRVLALSTHDQPPAVDAQGAEIVHVSPLTVVPRFADVKARLGRLSEVRAIAVTSRHGVDALVGGLVALGHDARALAGIKLAAVGEATARRFEALQLRPDLVGAGGGAELAQEIAAAGWEGPVLVLRAAGGREELPAALAAAGYAALVVDAYDTIPDDGALNRALKQHRVQSFDAVAFSSPKGVGAFLELAGGGKALGGALVGAIGETTRAALAAAGVTATVVPDRPELARLLEALLDRLAKVP